ncbi:MAG: gluzincin family metallopeptidase, partial [Planctomycetota bacterium]
MAERTISCAWLLLLLSGLAFAESSEPEAAPITCTLRARFNPGEHRIAGVAEFRIVNTTKKPLDEIPIHVYANRLLHPNKALNDVNYSWSYPRTFEPGYMEIPRLWVLGEGTKGVSPRFSQAKDRPAKTLMRVDLDPPLPRGKTATLRMEFETIIPRKYGTFGYYDGATLLNGGWYPHPAVLDSEHGWLIKAPPAPIRFDVEVDRPEGWEAILNGVHFPPKAPVRRQGTACFLTLALAKTFHRYTADASGTEIVYFRLGESSGSGRRVCREAARVVDYARK